jgi:MFS family permease
VPDYYVLERRGRAFSVQQCLTFVGTGVGVLAGGLIGPAFGWRVALVVVSLPGLAVAVLLTRVREPVRGAADRVQVGAAEQLEFIDPHAPGPPLFEHGLRRFVRLLLVGLGRDLRVIWSIPTMRFALCGVSAVLFVLTAVASWMTQFYQRQLGLTQGQATAAFLVLVVAGGIPGVIVGGRVADRFATRIVGARVVLPGLALTAATTLFIVSLARVPFAVCLPVQLVGFFFATSAIPGLRAGLTDAVPSTLRGTGFGAFNLASVLFGTAAAPLVTAFFSQRYGDDLRTAFLIVLPLSYVGSGLLIAARRHLDEDTRRLQAIVSEAALHPLR